MDDDTIPVRSFWARFVSTLFSTLKDVKKLVTITTTKESSSCFRKSMKKYFWNHHAWKSQNPKMTKIGDSFVVDISKIFTFSGMFVWNLPEPSVSVFTILNCREPSLSVLHDRINNPLAFFTILSITIGWRSSRLSRTIRWRYFTILGLKNHSVVLFKRYTKSC